MCYFKFLFAVVILLLVSTLAKSQLVINEFMASNTGEFVDPEFGESSDWIEIHNAGDVAVHIGGFFLTDNFNEPEKWVVPIGVEIPAHGFVVIWADGENTGLHTNFKLSSSGEEIAFYSPMVDLLDSVSFGLQEPNISLGRVDDGNKEWGFFTAASPGESNNVSENFEGIVKNKPQFIPLGGIFNAPILVQLKNTFGGTIRYTVDGSEPNENSSIYKSPFTISKNTVLRARIYKPDEVPGEVITHSYFIDQDNTIGSLPVVSISADSMDFWSKERGIYYLKDYKDTREIAINIELFENDGSDRAAFNLRAGTKINGLYSWQLPQKMLGIYFRKEYGSGKLEYPIFHDRERNVFDSFSLRASGSDWAKTLMRDGIGQSLTNEHMNIDFQGFRQCVLFVNGYYMGIHNIRSKVDEDFIVQNHNLGGQRIDMIGYEEVVEAGSMNQYAIFEDLYHKDLSNANNFKLVSDLMDVENFTDFIIAEIFTGNSSIGHNVMTWKPQFGGKWKWILMDLDRGFEGVSNEKINFYEKSNVIPLGHLLKNNDYKKYFGRRLADHLFTTYNPTRVKSLIDIMKNNIDNEIPKHVLRWEGHKPLDIPENNYRMYYPISSYDYWIDEVDKLKTFAEGRIGVLIDDLTNYGFDSALPITVSTFPLVGGSVLFNGLKVTNSYNTGAYPSNENITLTAVANNGYTFKGWGVDQTISFIPKQAIWKYNDRGEELSSNWNKQNYDDASWAEGMGVLGYGDGQDTKISYGGNSSKKHITTYLRKSFNVETTSEIKSLKIELLVDDGAIVYLNGTEVSRSNLPSGKVSFNTTALEPIGGDAEDEYSTFLASADLIVKGENTIAVEVHQSSQTSSDLSFDLKLSAVVIGQNNIISNDIAYTFKHTTGTSLIAFFETENECVLPQVIEGEYTLSAECSPYNVPTDVEVVKAARLIIEPGVELHMGDDVSINVNGAIRVNGTESKPVLFRSSPFSVNKKWGNINIVNADTSVFNHVVIEDASKGIHPVREIAAISAFNSVLRLDHVVIEKVHASPVLARLSDVVMTNSRLHSKITGDLINVKYGKARIENCEFIGNDEPDADAIDYDDITDGVIRNCIIRDFHGFNSDAIDIGEKATNVSIENVVVYNITDKGVSVGQQSSAKIKNSIFVNCDMGAGLKDSSKVSIDHCTYYGNNTAVANYEKNPGDAGGNVVITNSILSNSYEESYLNDAHSSIKISNSASDNDALPAGYDNVFANPQFSNPNLFDFSLASNSICVNAGNDGNMGADLKVEKPFNQIFISAIAYNSEEGEEDLEFIAISNTGTEVWDISRYVFTKGIIFEFPDYSKVHAGETVYVSNNASANFWMGRGGNVYQWDDGRLADEGEAIQFESANGIIIDRIKYNDKKPWPEVTRGEGIQLKGDNLDNHFGDNWKAVKYDALVGLDEKISDISYQVYPNPTSGIINLKGFKSNDRVEIFNLSGIRLYSKQINTESHQIDLSYLQAGVYIVQIDDVKRRVLIVK